jgi:hypothetical protein
MALAGPQILFTRNPGLQRILALFLLPLRTALLFRA